MRIQAFSQQRSELFAMTRQVAPLNCATGAKSPVAGCLLASVVTWMHMFVVLFLLHIEKVVLLR